MASYQRQVSCKVWKDHKEKMREGLHTAIFTYLTEEELLGEIEGRTIQKYNDLQEDYRKIDLIICSVPKSCHDDYLIKFIDCLRKSNEDDGGLKVHKEIADSMETQYLDLMRRAKQSKSFRESLYSDDALLRLSTVTTSISSVSEYHDQTGYSHFRRTVRSEGNYLVLTSPKLKMCCKYRFAPFVSSLVWLVTGSVIVAVLHSKWPPQGPSHPSSIQCGQTYTISVDLGIDLFWLTSFSMKLEKANTKGYVYIANISCSKAPTANYTTEFNNIPPYYLVSGSSMNVTNSINTTVEFWVLKKAFVDTYTCDETSRMICDRPPNNTLSCHHIKSSETFSYQMAISDYYVFCVKGKLITKAQDFVTYSINKVTYNRTAIKQLYSPSTKISSEKDTTVSVPQHKKFSFGYVNYCVLLDLSTCGSYKTAPLNVSVSKREDYLLIPVFLFIILPIMLHLVLAAVIVSYCRKRSKQSYNELKSYT